MSNASIHKQGIPFAWRLSDQQMVGPEDVEKGLKCNCICKACGASLVAKQGAVREWHFAHHAATDCPSGLETAIHWMAKQLIVDRGEVCMPQRILNRKVSGPQWVWTETINVEVQREGLFPLHDCVQEKEIGMRASTEGTRRPDVLAMFNGRPIAVEICNTHAVDEEKLEWLKKNGISSLEIGVADLSQAPADQIRYELERRLFTPSFFMKWLVHSGDMEAHERLDEAERNLRISKASEEAALLAELVRKTAVQKRKQEFLENIREIECRVFRPESLITIRVGRSKIRCTLKWVGHAPDWVKREVCDFAHRHCGRFNKHYYHWEFDARHYVPTTMFENMCAWAQEELNGGLEKPIKDTSKPLPEDFYPRTLIRFDDPERQEEYEERAAIMEFDGNIHRPDAEQAAFTLIDMLCI